ncbi:MAG: hypothetical protein KKF41_01540 [Actinobacteria bacterium]|nr:hypothetical protein [Actinomycetota bacterium]MBU1942164.1 hypothetical protein [Actinomycetota bacterium]MBU2686248.1 hypothetical protein [Actinomycetota bacterium]
MIATGSKAQIGSAMSSGGKNSALVTWVDYAPGATKGQAHGRWVGDLFPNTY